MLACVVVVKVVAVLEARMQLHAPETCDGSAFAGSPHDFWTAAAAADLRTLALSVGHEVAVVLSIVNDSFGK